MTVGARSKIRSSAVGVVTVAVLALVGGIVFVGRGQASPSLHLGSGAAWFPTLRQGSVALIDGATGGRVTRIDGVAKSNGHFEVEQSGSSALVVDHDTGTVTKIDAATWKLGAPVPVGSPGDPKLAVHAGGASAWVVLQAGSQVQQLDPTAMTLIGSPQTLPSTISGLAVSGDGRLWVTSQSGELRSYRNGEQVTSVALGGAGATALVLVDQQPVVVDLARGGAQLVDAERGTPDRPVCLDVPTTPPPVVGGSTGDAPWLLAVAPTAGTLVVSDVGGSSCQAITLGPTAASSRYGTPVEKDRFVFVPDFVAGQVIVVDPQAPPGTQIRARIDLGLPNAQVALLVHNQHVWFNDPGGDQAGVITDDFHALTTSKADAGSSTGQTPAPTPTPDPGPATPDTTGDPGTNAASNTPTVPADPAAGTPPGSPTDIGLPASAADLPSPQDNGHRGGDKKPATSGGSGGGGAAPTTTTTPGAAGGTGAGGGVPPSTAPAVVTPEFTISPTDAVTGEPVTFTDATQAAHSLVGWSLPGGVPATSKAASFQATFAEAKTYEITLTIATDVGALSVTRRLTVNTVPKVPPLAGRTMAEATSLLTLAGLTLGPKTATVASIFPAGRVVDSTPAAGAPVAAGSSVSFRDSSGDGIIGSLMGSAGAGLVYPARLAADGVGNVYVADTEGNRVKKIDAATGVVTVVAGNGNATDPSMGAAFALGDGGPAVAATLSFPTSVAVDAQGDVYIGDSGNNRVRKVTRSTGIITTFAGNGNAHNGLIVPNSPKAGDFNSDTTPGPALATSIGGVNDLAVDAAGTLYIVDGDGSGCNVLLVNQAGILSIMPEPQNGWLVAPTSIALGRDGSIWVAEATRSRIRRYLPDGTMVLAVGASYVGSTYSGEGTLGPDTLVNQPDTIRFDAFDNLWFTDSENNRIRVLRADDNKVYTAAGNGTAGSGGDGGPATGAQVWLTNSGLYGGLAFDGQGNLYFSDVNIRAIRKISARPPGG